jgi:NCAIR mutase (PurE)-related protein
VSSRRDLDPLLMAVADREMRPRTPPSAFATLPLRDLGFARVDTHRQLRQGAPEAILGEGKTPVKREAS